MPSNYVGLRVEINGAHSDKEWTRFKLVAVNSKHVVGYLVQRHYLGANSRQSRRIYYRNRSRVHVLFGEFPEKGLSRNFFGYITSHRQGDTGKDANGKYVEVTYYVVGTSDQMQAKHTWTGWSWSSAAKRIAKRHKLKAVVHQTPKLSKPLVQTQSDFKFLVTGAKQTGYRFFVWNNTLYFVNAKKMLNTKTVSTPMFEGTAVREIDVEATETDQPRYEVTGVDANGNTITETSGPVDDSQEEYWDDEVVPATVEYESAVVESLAEARQAIEARVVSDEQWVTATVVTDGDARVIPGRVIYLAGTDMPEDQKGLWIVNSVTHQIDITTTQKPERAYWLEMILSRDRMRAVEIPAVGDGFEDLEDPEETVPWESSEEWISSDYDDESDTLAVGGVWQAEFYGDDSQTEYWDN